MSTTQTNGCNDCNPCNECDETTVENTCSVLLDTSCVLYNIKGDGPSLLTGLNLPNGSNLTQVLNAIDAKLNGLVGYNTTTFNLTFLRDEYNITDLQTVIEALNNKVYSNVNRIIRLESAYTNLSNLYQDLLNKFNTPELNPLYNIIIDQGDSIEESITKIINYLGELADSGNSGSSPNIVTINTNSVAFSTSGPQSHTITANVVVAPDANNLLKIKSTGLYVENVKQTISYDPITRKICLSNDGGCFILPLDDKQLEETPLTTLNSETIEFVTSGKNGHTITGHVNVKSVLNSITNSAVLRQQFCNICSADPCLGQSIAPTWTETGETRCVNFTLEKKQRDNNNCSPSYNTYRWVTAQTNSLLCGYQSLAYCFKLDCTTKSCVNTGCKSIQLCLTNSLTGQATTVNEDVEIFYTLNVNNVATQKSVTLHQGQSSVESTCHCGNSTDVITITNIEMIGQATDNNGIGYPICSNVSVTPTPTSQNNIVLTQDCNNYTMTVSGTFIAPASTTRTITLYKDNIAIKTRTVTTNVFNEIFTGVVGGNKYYVKIVEDGSVSNTFTTELYTTPCTTQVNSVISTSCSNKSVTVTGSMGEALSVNIDLLKDGLLVTNRVVSGPNYATTFLNLEDGYYYAEIKPEGAQSEAISTNVALLQCVTTPTPGTPSPTQQSNASITNDCVSNTINARGILLGANRISIALYKNNQIVETREDQVGPNFNVTFASVLNGNYYVRVFEINNDTNFKQSSVLTINCSTVTVPTTPTPAPVVNSLTISGDCAGRTLTADVSLENINGTGLVLYRNGEIYRTVDNLYGQKYFWTFNSVDQEGEYYVRVFELNKDSNTLTSTTQTFDCAPEPVTTPITGPTQPNGISISGDCSGKTVTADIYLSNTNGVIVRLYKNNQIIRVKQSTNEQAFIASFSDVADNGTYKVVASEINNDVNMVTSNEIEFTCNTVTVPEPTCTRPTNLTTYKLIYNYVQTSTSNAETFDTIDKACEKGQGYYNGTVHSATGFLAQTESLEVNKVFYLGTGTDCGRVGPNHYYVADKFDNNTVLKAITVNASGVITEVKTCTPATTVEPLGVVTINLHYDNQYRQTYTTNPSNWDTRWTTGRTPALYYASRIQFKSGTYSGQSAISNHYDTSSRFVGGNTPETAVAVASYDSIPYPGNPPQAVFNRFMISCKRLRERGYTGIVELDIYTKLITNQSQYDYISVKLGTQGTSGGDIVSVEPKNGSDFYFSGTASTAKDTGNVPADNKNQIGKEVKIAVAIIDLTNNTVKIQNA